MRRRQAPGLPLWHNLEQKISWGDVMDDGRAAIEVGGGVGGGGGRSNRRAVIWVLVVLVVLAAACGDSANTGMMPDAGGGSAGTDGGIADGGVDAAPVPVPVPSEPQGGELAWVTSAPGAGDPVQVATDRHGNIFVAATQTGEVVLDSLHVPAPASGQALLVLKLTPAGHPIWGRSVATAPAIEASDLAVTFAGDAVIGGTRRPSPDGGGHDGFVIALDGSSGATRWSVPLASIYGDHVAGIAIGFDATSDDPSQVRSPAAAQKVPDPVPAGVEAIYVYGKLGGSAVIGGDTFPAGSYLLRFDDDGAMHWGQSLPRLAPDYGHALALDPLRGPVIAGRFSRTVTLGGQRLTAEFDPSSAHDAVVAGFDHHGQVRFARQVTPVYAEAAPSLNVTVAPGGDIYLASDTSGSQTLVDDHLIPTPSTLRQMFLLRLTPEGRYVSSRVIAGRRSEWSSGVVTDAAGAVYLLGTCSGGLDVQPEIDCSGSGSVILSYGANDRAQWATYVAPAFVEAIATAPGNRLIVAGQALSGETDFGGVRVPTQQLFIASLASGPARLPSPLPAAPAISSVKLDGIADRELRQGGTATLVIEGTGLDQVTEARLGDLDVHVPAGAGMPTMLRLPVTIPNGHAPGWLGLVLGSAGGSAQAAAAVNVTPVVVSPTGTSAGRGTFASPMRLCDLDSFQLRHGDVLLLRNGVHTCNKGFFVRRGVIIRGESKAGTIIRGSGSSSPFGGFRGQSGRAGAMAVERLTFESAGYGAAISVSGSTARVTVTDVDVQGASGSGIWVDQGAAATVSRYRYRQSSGTAIVIGHGHVDASLVDASGAYRGVLMSQGTLTLASSSLSSDEDAIQAGSLNDHPGTRDVTISGTTLRSSSRGIAAVAARLTVTGSTIEALASSTSSEGIFVEGGELKLSASIVHGWHFCLDAQEVFPTDISWLTPAAGPDAALASTLEEVVNIDLDQVELSSCYSGVYYSTGWYSGTGGLESRLRLRRSQVTASEYAVTLSGRFAAADLGTAASPGDNQLGTASGGPALRDYRNTAGVDVDAHGTTLNGTTFSGVVSGPITVPGAYSISAPNKIRF